MSAPAVRSTAPALFRGPVRLIQERVAEEFVISIDELLSTDRAVMFVEPRQIAMYLAWICRLKSLPEIGRLFNRDHTTVLHAVRKVKSLIVKNAEYAARVERLRAELAPQMPRTALKQVESIDDNQSRDLAHKLARLLLVGLRRDPKLLIDTLRRFEGTAP